VQSVALRLVSEREEEVAAFNPQEYWSIAAEFDTSSRVSSSSASASNVQRLPAKLVEVDGQRLPPMALATEAQARELEARLWQQQQQQQPCEQQQEQATVWYTVRSVVKRPVRRNPPPPLVTSTLQQEAARRLGFSASKTMQVAQQLYEGADAGESHRGGGGQGTHTARGTAQHSRTPRHSHAFPHTHANAHTPHKRHSPTGEGLITYMRTDGVSLSAEAVEGLRDTIAAVFGPAALPAGGPRAYKSRAKNAQVCVCVCVRVRVCCARAWL
jgi:DNA topoisomerase-1